MKTTRLFRMAPLALVMLLLAGPLFLSCSNEFDPWGTEDDSELMTISVNQGGTRTTNDGNSTLWGEGDALSVIHSTTGGDTFWSSRFGYSGGNSFQGSVSRLSSSNDWYAVYPYVEENNAANGIHLDFPTRQVQVGNGNKSHFSGEQFPMFGKKTGVSRSDELSLSMKNVLSAAGFKVKNTEDYPIVVKEIELTSSSYIAGGFKVDLTSEEPVFTAESGSKTVRLVVTDGEAIAATDSALFYMAVAPFDIPAGGSFEIKVVAENASNPGTNVVYYHTYDLANGASFASGLIKTIKVDFDDDSSQDPNPGTAGEVELEVGEQPEDGVYLLVYENGANSMAFAAFDEYKSQNFAIPVVVADGVVLPQDGIDLARFAVELENTGMEHPNDAGHDAYNVRNSEGKYVFYATAGGTYEGTDAFHIMDSNEMDVQGTTYQYYHTFMQTEDGVRIVCSINTGGNFYLLSYTSANGFNYQQDSAAGTNLHLFRLGGTVKEKQYPAFSAERVEYDFDASGPGVLANAPTLTGAKTSVTYSSSNESVASVDADGNVTVHKAGTATITATAAADDVYYSATAQYLIVSTTSAGTTFYRVTEFTAGEQYLIVSAGKALTNNGTIDATDVSASGDEVIVSDAASMTWTATASGSGFTLSNNGKYVQRGSGSSGKPSIGNAPSSTNYYIWTYSGGKMYTATGTSYYLYYSSGWAQTSTANSAGSVTIYSSTKPLSKQTLSFAQASVAWVIGEGYEINGSYAFPQTVSGNITPVTYTSSNTNIATISGDRITIVGTGSTTIKARTEGNAEYAPAEASYTLRINQKAPDGFVSLGTINLENSSVKNYLDNGTNDYTDDNYSSKTNIAEYAPSTSSSTRVDIPNPVSLDWGTASSGTVTITVYNDQALTDEFWTWTATKGSTSYDIYNLIPGRTYYCTVVDDANSNYLYKATFNTEGRRRMLKVSDTRSQNNANNCRDLGGMITKDGTKRIRYGMIYRGTNLTGTTAAEKKLLAEFMNIGLDNDLRDGSGGGSNRDNPFQNTSYAVAYCGPGYTTTISEWPSGTYTSTGVGSSSGWGSGNANYLTNPVRAYLTMQAFIDAAKRGKASYFHCYIGSDRTGYWGLVLEGLLGVSAKDCSIDFELTSFANSVTSGNRLRTSGTYKDGMNFFKAKSYYNNYANDVNHQLQNTITYYFVNEVGQYIVDHRSEILDVYKDSATEYQLFQNFTIEGFAADIETFKSLLLEDI